MSLILCACSSAPRAPAPGLERAVRALIAQLDSEQVAVSYIDLGGGREFHINGDVSMHAASTMKVPVLLELFHRAESDPAFSLDRKVAVRNLFRSIADTSHYSLDPADDSDSLVYTLVGDSAPLRYLARHMIVRSSNLATNLLIDLLTADSIQRTLARVNTTGMHVLRGVEDGAAFRKGMNNTTTGRGLASTLEAIARCTITSRASCEEMVQILSSQEFNEMIPAGVPPGTRIAHKTGWITGIRHDGAIVYPPNGRPYILVILTRGFAKPEAADRFGANISRVVWQAAGAAR